MRGKTTTSKVKRHMMLGWRPRRLLFQGEPGSPLDQWAVGFTLNTGGHERGIAERVGPRVQLPCLNLALPLTSHVTLGKLFKLPGPQFSHV